MNKTGEKEMTNISAVGCDEAKIKEMLEMQDQMNSVINKDWRDEHNAWYRAGWLELAEMSEHCSWKWWKKQTMDVEQMKLELVDVMHFALSISLEKNTLNDILSIEGDFHNPILNEDFTSFTDILNKEQILETIEYTVLAIIKTRSISFRRIAGIMCVIGMDFNEMYELYIGKNVLNMFRQDHGYKEGTYTKVWEGKEDNEHLTSIIDRLKYSGNLSVITIRESLETIYPG